MLAVILKMDLSQPTLVAEHQGDSKKPILATEFAFDVRALLLQPINEEKCQQNDVLCNLRR